MSEPTTLQLSTSNYTQMIALQIHIVLLMLNLTTMTNVTRPCQSITHKINGWCWNPEQWRMDGWMERNGKAWMEMSWQGCQIGPDFTAQSGNPLIHSFESPTRVARLGQISSPIWQPYDSLVQSFESTTRVARLGQMSRPIWQPYDSLVWITDQGCQIGLEIWHNLATLVVDSLFNVKNQWPELPDWVRFPTQSGNPSCSAAARVSS